MSDNVVVELPRRPSAADPAEEQLPPKFNAQSAPAPAPAREKRAWLSGAWLSGARLQLQLRVAGLLTGVSPLISPSPSLLTVWARHTAAARHYRHWWARWPTWWYGLVHTWLLATPAYFVIWASDSRPKLLVTVAVLVTTLWLFGVI